MLSKEIWNTWVNNVWFWARSSTAPEWLILCRARSSGAHEYLHLCWVRISRTNEKIIESVGHNPWSLPCWCWAKPLEHRILHHCIPRCIVQVHPIIQVHVGKTHVFVIMRMNNEKCLRPLIVAPLCKKSNLLSVCRFLHMAWVTYPTKGVIWSTAMRSESSLFTDRCKFWVTGLTAKYV